MDVSQFDINNIIFSDSKKNIIMDGNYIKIIYSDECISINGLFFHLQLALPKPVSPAHNTKFNILEPVNNEMIYSIIKLESELLNYYLNFIQNTDKIMIYSLKDQFNRGSFTPIRVSNTLTNPNVNVQNTVDESIRVLKISGIWETPTTIGLTYKISILCKNKI